MFHLCLRAIHASTEEHIDFQSLVKGPLGAKHLWVVVMSFVARSWLRKVYFGSEI